MTQSPLLLQDGYDKQDIEKPQYLEEIDFDILTSKCFGGAKDGYPMFSMNTLSVLDYLVSFSTLSSGDSDSNTQKTIFSATNLNAYFHQDAVVDEFSLKLKYPALRFRIINPEDFDSEDSDDQDTQLDAASGGGAGGRGGAEGRGGARA